MVFPKSFFPMQNQTINTIRNYPNSNYLNLLIIRHSFWVFSLVNFSHRSIMTWQYIGLISIILHLRFNFSQAIRVVPLPPKGSKIISPLLTLPLSNNHIHTPIGLGVGCPSFSLTSLGVTLLNLFETSLTSSLRNSTSFKISETFFRAILIILLRHYHTRFRIRFQGI